MSSSMEQDRMIGGIKNDNGTWYVMIRYQDWTGARKQKCKRGFSTRKEAADWELQFKLQKKASVDMTMESFCTMYEEDVRPSLKQSTWLTKENIIQKKILPYLGKRKVSEITAKDVMDLIIPGLSEPPVRTLRATIPGNESQLKFLILDD